jgi:carbon-monoxide dehydrogenase small subunit
VNQHTRVTFALNGTQREFHVDSRMLLVELLRDCAGLTGCRIGCDTAQCGACTVLVDGKSIKSCNRFALQVQGRVVTIEGLGDSSAGLHPLQIAFLECSAQQCGFCTPGMIMAAVEFLCGLSDSPSEAQIQEALSGNLCRCTGYRHIMDAIAVAARKES